MGEMRTYIKDRGDTMKRKTVEEAITLGLYLKGQKDMLPHGSFLPWIQREFGFHPTTAARYMRYSKHAVKLVENARRESSS